MKEEIKRKEKIIEYEGRPAKLTVEYGLYYTHGNSKPYFGISGKLHFLDKKGGDMYGQITSIIFEHFPELEQFYKLHLSDVDGMPMHAIENGWYFLGKTEYSPYDRNALAKHLRITPEEADHLHETIQTKNDFVNYVRNNMARWKLEADRIINDLNLKVPVFPNT